MIYLCSCIKGSNTHLPNRKSDVTKPYPCMIVKPSLFRSTSDWWAEHPALLLLCGWPSRMASSLRGVIFYPSCPSFWHLHWWRTRNTLKARLPSARSGLCQSLRPVNNVLLVRTTALWYSARAPALHFPDVIWQKHNEKNFRERWKM